MPLRIFFLDRQELLAKHTKIDLMKLQSLTTWQISTMDYIYIFCGMLSQSKDTKAWD